MTVSLSTLAMTRLSVAADFCGSGGADEGKLGDDEGDLGANDGGLGAGLLAGFFSLGTAFLRLSGGMN